jgi:hypothetical protein
VDSPRAEHARRVTRRRRFGREAAASSLAPCPGDTHTGRPVGAPPWLERKWQAEGRWTDD